MTRISDKPLAFQALQQRRRKRGDVLRLKQQRRTAIAEWYSLPGWARVMAHVLRVRPF